MIFTSKKNGIQTMETREDFYSGTPRILPALRILVQLVKLCLITRTMIWSQLSRVGREGQVIVEQCKLPNKLTIYLQIYCDVS